MRHWVAVLLLIAFAGRGDAGDSYSRTMSGWFNVTAPNGWVGRRYMDGPHVFAEEFDSNSDGRIDIWRFYRRGILSSEERDTNSVGRVNFQSKWEVRGGRLISVLRDTRSRGVNDVEIEYVARNRWEIREDRNLDGITDRILYVNGGPELFEGLGMDLANQPNIIDSVPPEYWYELWSDDAFTSTITEYRRYTNGQLSHFGEWNDGEIVWQRRPPDYLPPQQIASREPDEFEEQPTQEAPEDPGNWAGSVGAEPAPTASTFTGQTGGTFRDRTRYESLPPGDSAARSVPARMRPPGTSRR